MAAVEGGLVVAPGLIVRERTHPDRREVVTHPGQEGELLFNVAVLEGPTEAPILNPLSGHSVTLGEVEIVPDAYMGAKDALAAEIRFWQSDRGRSSAPAPVVEASIREAPMLYQDWGSSRFVRYGDYGLQAS